MPEENIADLAHRQRPGLTLEQAFYCSTDVFQRDVDTIINRLWLLVDHESRIPAIGDYFLFEIGLESIIIVRKDKDSIGAYFNVCRHRGSRLCYDKQGKKRLFVCPYHAWSYSLDGRLKEARLMPPGFDKTSNGLHQCHVRLSNGLIFICLSEGEPPDFDADYAEFEPMMAFHGFGQAKIAEKRNYPTAANWKLVVENFLECYHCGPAHPEYCSLHPPEQVLAMGAGPGSGPDDAALAYQAVLDNWQQVVEKLGHPFPNISQEEDSVHMTHLYRYPLNSRGDQSETRDGRPASRMLMGKFKQCDGGISIFSFSPVGYILASNDYAMMIRFTPRTSTFTDVEVSWLVHRDATEGSDYTIDNLAWLWDVTTIQDKTITENNQAGVQSSRYRPGYYSEHEGRVKVFLKWYLRQVGNA